MKKQIKPIYIFLFAFALLLLDQVVKIIIKTTMTIGEEIEVFSWFRIYFIENNGAAYGMSLGGEYGKLILSVARLIIISLFIVYLVKLYKKQMDTGFLLAFTMIITGALGNLLDSAFYGLIFEQSTMTHVAGLTSDGYAPFLYGKVVDMLYFPLFTIDNPFWSDSPYTFFSPIFNIADSYITIAVFYLLIFQRKNLK